jgi:hypothetical protein
MFELIGTAKVGGLVHEAFESQDEAMVKARRVCESFEILDKDGYQVFVDYPPVRWV